jgi:hypothetical protein
MKLNLLGLAAAAALLAMVSGCTTAPDGSKHVAVPGKNQIVSRYERNVDQIFNAAKEVLRFNGTLTREELVTHTLEARVDTRTVWVGVEEVEPKITKVTVKALKKSKMADVDLAAEIDKQIALRLR